MKIILIITITLLSIAAIAQVIVKRSTKNTENHPYTVIKDYGSFEIRTYEPAIYSYVVMESGTYKSASSQGFRKLAAYIFGGNEKNQKIAMTTPVSMSMQDSTVMKFKVPEGMEMEDLPKPNDPSVKFEKEEEKTVAALQFGGFANDDIIAAKTEELKTLLEGEGITHKGNFSFLGYNPPYEVVDRRNEVIVEIDYEG